MKLNERLVSLRKASGLTQEAMARALFVSRQTIYKWETGKAQPDLQKFAQLCALFHVSADSLLDTVNHIEPITDDLTPLDDAEDGAEQPETPAPAMVMEYADAAGAKPSLLPMPHASNAKRRVTLACIAILSAVLLLCYALYATLHADGEIQAARETGIVPAGMDVHAAGIREVDFLQMLQAASQRQHPQEIPRLAEALHQASHQPLTREKAAYWLYCAHVWTTVDPNADMTIGRNGAIDPISQRNVYEELNDMSRTHIPGGDPWDTQVCAEAAEVAPFFDQHDGSATMDAQIGAIVNGAYYTSMVFCASQRCFGSEKPVIELINERFSPKEPLTASDAVKAVYRLLGSW